MASDALVRDYLGRLEAAAWPLAPDRRAELVGEVREHIEVALGEAGRGDEVTVRNVLERLGPPEEIVAAEVSAPGQTVSPGGVQGVTGARQKPIGAVEILGLLFLTLGSIFLPFVGPLIGLILVWLSDHWTRREKLVATGIVVVLLAVPIIGLMAYTTGGATSGSAPLTSPPIPQLAP